MYIYIYIYGKGNFKDCSRFAPSGIKAWKNKKIWIVAESLFHDMIDAGSWCWTWARMEIAYCTPSPHPPDRLI